MVKRDLLNTSALTPVVNEEGYRIGESHPRAQLTDEQVDLMRDLYESGQAGYRRLSEMFNTPKRTVRDICTYRRRNQFPHVEAGKPHRR